MLQDLQIRHYSPTTVRIYLHVIAEFARHFARDSRTATMRWRGVGKNFRVRVCQRSGPRFS